MSDTRFATCMFAVVLVGMFALWVHIGIRNMPYWCAHPEIGGNAHLQPMCKKLHY